jgi:hypothetical protein
MKTWNKLPPNAGPFSMGEGRFLRRGTTAFEVIVSFSLLSSVLAFATPLVVRHTRLLASQRHYRLALDELSNQLERLSALAAEERVAALDKIGPSPFAAEHLPGAELRGELAESDDGQRVTLRLTWDEPQRSGAPLSLTAWMSSESRTAGNPPAGREQP